MMPRLSTRLTGAWTAALLVAVLAANAQPVPEGLAKAIPGDAIAAFFVDGGNASADGVPSESALSTGVSLADQAQRLGLLSATEACTRMWIDALAAAAHVLKNPHALVLLDIQAEPRVDGGHQLAGLEAALLVRTPLDDASIEPRIQHLLQTYTNREESDLTQRSDQGNTTFTLRDRRLPPWASLTWGRVGDYYVVGFGHRAYDHVVKTLAGEVPSLSNDPWFKQSRGRVGSIPSVLTVYARTDGLGDQLDSSLRAKINNALSALELSSMQRGLWSFGWKGRSMEVVQIVQRRDQDRVRRLIGEHAQRRLAAPIIPTEAEGFAILDGRPQAVLEGLANAYLAARSPHTRAKLLTYWRGFEEEAGASTSRDVYPLLGGPVLLHDYPPHALGIPFAWSVVVPIKGEGAVLRRHIDRWMSKAQSELAQVDGVQLHRDADGLWYTQYGLMGPAMSVTDRWLVFSFSPDGVRQNLAILSTGDSEKPGSTPDVEQALGP